MRRTLSGLSFAAGLLVLGTACSNPPPTCAPGEESYRVCADDQVWECPQGTAAQIAAKQDIEAACQEEADPIQCLFDAEFEMVEMRLVADCAAADQVCVDETTATDRTATCENPA